MLGLRNFSFATERNQRSSPTIDDQIELWQDPSGPLRLCRVGSFKDRHYRLHLDDTVAVDILPDRQMLVLANPEIPKSTVEHFLADQVMPRVIAQDGEFVLHSAAVRVGNGAILLLGASGSGKSTLAASFRCDGFLLMGDDAVIISFGECPLAKALYASLRLFPDSIAALLPGDAIREDIAHYSNKQRLSASFEKEIEDELTSISAIFFLQEGVDDTVSVTRLSIAEACMAVLENSFALDPTDAHRARKRLAAASDLASRIPAFTISYPRDYARLSDVRSAIVAQLN